MKPRSKQSTTSNKESNGTADICIPKKPAGAVAGAVVGAVVGGPIGAAIGGVLGTFVAAKSESGTLKLPNVATIKKAPAAAKKMSRHVKKKGAVRSVVTRRGTKISRDKSRSQPVSRSVSH